MSPSRVAFLWHLFGRPFRVLPKVQFKIAPDIQGGLAGVSWLGMQILLGWGEVAQYMTAGMVSE